MRILIAEDDIMLGRSLKKGVEAAGYNADWVEDGEAALIASTSDDFALLILDMNLPKLSGIEVLKNLRIKGKKIPVLILTARSELENRIDGLDSGADDYMVKPFDLSELLARIRALVRRSHGRAEEKIAVGDIEVDIAAKMVRKKNEMMVLPAKEFKLLSLLVQNMGKIISKTEIENNIYDLDERFESNTVEVIIYNLRRKFGKNLIKTARGTGYVIEK